MNLNAANISKLIWYMEGLDDPRFTMDHFTHPCGTPACALGHAAALFGRMAELGKTRYWAEFSREVFGKDALLPLFGFLQVYSPQQWALHARRVLAKAGLEVEPNAAGQELGATRLESPLSGPVPAAPYDFQAFMERVMEPVTTKEKA